MDDDDLRVGEGDAVIDGLDGGIVPAADFAEVDAGEDFGGEAEVLGDIVEIVDRDYGADGGGELEGFCWHRSQLGRRERNVGCGEGDLLLA